MKNRERDKNTVTESASSSNESTKNEQIRTNTKDDISQSYVSESTQKQIENTKKNWYSLRQKKKPYVLFTNKKAC